MPDWFSASMRGDSAQKELVSIPQDDDTGQHGQWQAWRGRGERFTYSVDCAVQCGCVHDGVESICPVCRSDASEVVGAVQFCVECGFKVDLDEWNIFSLFFVVLFLEVGLHVCEWFVKMLLVSIAFFGVSRPSCQAREALIQGRFGVLINRNFWTRSQKNPYSRVKESGWRRWRHRGTAGATRDRSELREALLVTHV